MDWVMLEMIIVAKRTMTPAGFASYFASLIADGSVSRWDQSWRKADFTIHHAWNCACVVCYYDNKGIWSDAKNWRNSARV